MIDLPDHQRIAEAATPGPWRSNYEHVWATGYRVASADWDLSGSRPSAQCFADAHFIATFDPPTVLQYIEEVRRLTAALEEEKADHEDTIACWKSEETRLSAGWTAAESQVRRLREALEEARDLLLERKQGSAARSAGHNARLVIDEALSLSGGGQGDKGPSVAESAPALHGADTGAAEVGKENS